jgi:uncharacterized protein YuzE
VNRTLEPAGADDDRHRAIRVQPASYDAEADVLYLRKGESRPAADVLATQEGHAVRLDSNGHVIGMTIVNAKWLIERDGKIVITVPNAIEATAGELAHALAASGSGR